MISANAVANEVAIQMLDKFDLTDWKFSGEDAGSAARVLVVPPTLPPATGYFVVVAVNEDQPIDPQLGTAIDNLSKLMTSGGGVQAGQTPDDKLDGFFAGLNMPPEQAAAAEQQVKDQRHPKDGQQQQQAANPSS